MVLNQSDRKADDTRGNFLSNVAVNGQTGETRICNPFSVGKSPGNIADKMLPRKSSVSSQVCCVDDFTVYISCVCL